jgi:hypothetical protein
VSAHLVSACYVGCGFSVRSLFRRKNTIKPWNARPLDESAVRHVPPTVEVFEGARWLPKAGTKALAPPAEHSEQSQSSHSSLESVKYNQNLNFLPTLNLILHPMFSLSKMPLQIMMFINASGDESSTTGIQTQPIDPVSSHLQNTLIKSKIKRYEADENEKAYSN